MARPTAHQQYGYNTKTYIKGATNYELGELDKLVETKLFESVVEMVPEFKGYKSLDEAFTQFKKHNAQFNFGEDAEHNDLTQFIDWYVGTGNISFLAQADFGNYDNERKILNVLENTMNFWGWEYDFSVHMGKYGYLDLYRKMNNK